MASSAYAQVSDLSVYLPSVTGNQAAFNVFLNAASRFIDNRLGQHFYDDGYYTRYFDGDGTGHFMTDRPFFCSSGTIATCGQGATSLTYTASRLAPAPPQAGDSLTLDTGTLREIVSISAVSGTGPYTLTVGATAFAHAANTMATTLEVGLAYFENQPLSQRILTLDGDGVTPPTNFYNWPRNRPAAASSVQPTYKRPWYGIDVARIPISGTTYLPGSIEGYDTVAITAHWGWPAVPDEIKDLCCKLAARAWRAKDAGWAEAVGNEATGIVHYLGRLDPLDFELLQSDYNLTLW